MALASNRKGMTFSQMLRDVLVVSLNRGQFPTAIIGLIVIITLCRLSPADLSRLISASSLPREYISTQDTVSH